MVYELFYELFPLSHKDVTTNDPLNPWHSRSVLLKPQANVPGRQWNPKKKNENRTQNQHPWAAVLALLGLISMAQLADELWVPT